MSLDAQLQAVREQSVERMPAEVLKKMQDATMDLIKSGIAEQAKQKGDVIEDFELPAHTGKSVRLSELLQNGPAVINFYRGGWCPYCNFEMKALQDKLPEISNLGASLIGISPELPDETMSTAEKNEISFDVLSDQGNKVADAFGLVFKLPGDIQQIYNGFGLDLVKSNGDDSWTLPIPATYVIDADRTVLYAHVDPDYTHRAEPDDVVAALKN